MTDAYDFIALEFNENNYCLKATTQYLNEYRFCIQWLRYHESLIFWNYLFKEQNETGIVYFLNANIHWGKSVINRYLNFENILQNSVLSKILEKSLIRLQGIFQDQKVIFEATDMVANTLTEKANITNCIDLEKTIKITKPLSRAAGFGTRKRLI